MEAKDWDERYAASDQVWTSDPNPWVEEVVGPWQPGRALDVAAGEGRHALWLVRRGWTVDAVDFSAVAVDRMRELAGQVLTPEEQDRLGTAVGDATEPADTGGGGYDLVLLVYLQLPPGPWEAALAHAVAATRPGGRVVVVLHARRNLGEGTGGPQDPAVLRDPDHVVAEVGRLPVEVEVERAELRERPVADAARPALDTLVVLRVADPT